MTADILVGLQLSFRTSFNCRSEPVSYAAVEKDCTSGLVIEVFDDSDGAGADVVLLMAAKKAACQTLSKAFLKSMKTW